MAKQFDVYKCDECGNVVELMHAASSNLACCNQAMTQMDDSNKSGADATHVPVVEKTEKGFKISVGEKPHVMTDEHSIYFIEVIIGSNQRIFHLKPGDEPVVEFACCNTCDVKDVIVREYCDLHGLWTAAK